MEKLREREQRVLDYMKAVIKQKGYPPTVREIKTALDIKSTCTVHNDITRLVKLGYIRKDPSKTRALTIVEEEDSAPNDTLSTTQIPIVGNVAAGTPILAQQNIEGTFALPSSYAQENCFMLRVRGESMINIGIMDGDLILVKEQKTANNGEIVVAMVEGFDSEATVKTFYNEGSHIRLQPENDTMEPIIVKDVQIVGKVKGVFRYFS